MKRDQSRDATDIVNGLGARWAANFDDYASGQIDASQIECVLCHTAPCSCVTCPTHNMSTRSCRCP